MPSDGVLTPKSNPKKSRSGMAGMPLGPLVRSGPLLPSRLFIARRKISPKPSVTMAR